MFLSNFVYLSCLNSFCSFDLLWKFSKETENHQKELHVCMHIHKYRPTHLHDRPPQPPMANGLTGNRTSLEPRQCQYVQTKTLNIPGYTASRVIILLRLIKGLSDKMVLDKMVRTKWYGQNGSNFYRFQFNWIEYNNNLVTTSHEWMISLSGSKWKRD